MIGARVHRLAGIVSTLSEAHGELGKDALETVRKSREYIRVATGAPTSRTTFDCCFADPQQFGNRDVELVCEHKDGDE